MARKRKKNTTHVYTSTKVENEKVVFRGVNFLVLLSLFFIDSHWSIDLPETIYILVVGAILGVDIAALARRFIKKF